MVNEKQKYETLIISCWVVLIACFLIKIFGGNWFEIICENQNFINACEWLDNNLIVRAIIYAIFYFASSSLIMLSQLKYTITEKKALPIILSILGLSIIRQLYESREVDLIMDLVILIGIPLIIKIIENKAIKLNDVLRIICGVVLVFVFQLVSQIVKDVNIVYVDEYSLVFFILNIDYYIMIALYYLYSNRKEVKKDG